MTIRLLNIKDDGDLPGDDWLKLAVSDDPDRSSINTVHGHIAADGMRMHIVHSQKDIDCSCEYQQFHERINGVIETSKDNNFCFSMNRQYLLEALAGFGDWEQINFYIAGPDKPIVIQDNECSRTAIIMPMREESVSFKKPNIPKFSVKKAE